MPIPSLLRHPPYLLYVGARTASEFAYQMSAVAIAWQVYTLTHSALDLGLIGLVQFAPSALLTFYVGHVADRYDRPRVVQLCRLVFGLAAAILAWGSFAGWLRVPEIFAVALVFGIAEAFESPAQGALLSGVTPAGSLQRAAAFASGASEVAAISGPALGGICYAIAPGLPYAVVAAMWLIASGLNGAIRLAPTERNDEPTTLRDGFAAIGFLRANPLIFGTISLDLFAVLLGGATALLPIYARDVLHTGAWGLGVLRSAPAIGALLMTAVLTHTAIGKRAGAKLFGAVIAFGLATIVFALSHLLWLSLIALVALGAADAVSVVVRSSLVQLRTPDAMRGRVGAVHYLFVNASNQLGQFESGVTAALLGAVPAALVGGVGTVAVALVWMLLFPALRTVDRLE
ncbi:MAG: MFS transporter [Vulcanimicrobiaceae bacterium]